MKDYPIGTVFTDSQGVKLEVVQGNKCDGCYYDAARCRQVVDEDLSCSGIARDDNLNIIFRPVEPQPVCHFTQRNQVR